MAAPVVTVVIPTYNRGWCIERSVGSALAQGGSNIEVVVADDGSRDDTRAVLARIGDERVRVVGFEENRGLFQARKLGIEAARGEFVIQLDSDDELVRGAVDRFLAHRDALVGNVAVILAEYADAVTGRRRSQLPRSVGHTVLTYADWIRFTFPGDLLPFVHKRVFEVCPYECRSNYFVPNIWTNIAKHFSFYYLPETLGVVHLEGGDRVTRTKRANARRWVAGLEEFIETFGADIEAMEPSRMALVYRSLAVYQRSLGCTSESLVNILRALRYSPFDVKTWGRGVQCLLGAT